LHPPPQTCADSVLYGAATRRCGSDRIQEQHIKLQVLTLPALLSCRIFLYLFIHSFHLACAECDDSLPFSGASSIPLCYVLFPTTLHHQLFFCPPSLHLAIYFLVYLSILLSPNSYIILFWAFYFLPFSVHVQTNIIYLTLLSLLQ